MRTKHLFYTAAMAALFAACVNDDFETISKGQNAANDGRPVVTDVKLNFTTGVDTRLAFGEEGYAWETNDTIGALLMDNVLTLEENTSWLQKYQLVKNIHTSYPFTYSTTDQTWGCNTKMLEGNYFFAYPWESYEGRREVAHSLLKQSQNGISGDVVAESYADNQFFIGYSQIKAGTDAKDALTDVEMVPLLGAIQLRIVNTGTQSYHLNKIVLSGNNDIASVMTFNPTNAPYGASNKWNLEKGRLGNTNLNWSNPTETTFNYANYTGNEADAYANVANSASVYNIKEDDEYKRIEALRAVAQKHDDLSIEKSAQLTINGTDAERELLPGQKNTAYVLIMCNPITVTEGPDDRTDGKGLFLSIYTDEGFVQNINLSKVNGESTTNTVVTDAAVTEVGPGVKNTIRIQLEDNSFIKPEEMTIYNSSDLMQFIQWNAQIAGRRDMKAKLGQDVTFTNEMLEALVGTDPKVDLNKYLDINCGTNTLTLAEDVPANVLDNKYLEIIGNIVVEGELELTEDSKISSTVTITIEKEATLTINDEKAKVPGTIENNGTLEIGANAALKGTLTIKNNATVNVAKGGDSKADLTNNADAVINNNGYMQNVTNNKDGVINLGENSTISLYNNYGKVITAKGSTVSTVSGTNNGEIQVVDGAVINATGGVISTEFTGATLTSKTFENSNVNKVILTKSTTVTEDVTLTNVEIAGEGELLVNEGKTLTISNELLISGSATIGGKGTVSTANVKIEKDADITVANTATVVATGTYKNEGMVYNNGTFKIPGGAAAQGNNWKYEDAEDSSEAATLTTMKAAVKYWIINAVPNVEDSKYYAYNPTDIKAFIASMDVWVADVNGVKEAEELATAWDVESFASMATNASFVATFNSAVNSEILNEDNIKAATTKVISQGKFINTVIPDQDATLYENEAKANAALKVAVVAKLTGTAGMEDRIVAAAAYGITGLETALAATTNPVTAQYTYIWNGCKLDEVMEVYRLRNIGQWSDLLGIPAAQKWQDEVDAVNAGMNNLKTWMETVISANNTASDGYVAKAKEVVNKYIMEYQNWQYSQPQIAAAGK